jgi:peptide/nickel transport system substrate-binding protein
VNVVLDYDNSLEAYRSDKFSSFEKQPQPDGSILEQTGYWGVYGAVPAGSEAAAGGGSNTVLWIVLGAVVVVVLVGGGVLIGRRGKSADDRE